MITLKKLSFGALLLAAFSISSCSSSDEGSGDGGNGDGNGNGGNGTPITYNNYIPLAINNTWTYDVSSDDGTNVNTSTDVITADADVTIGSFTYTDMSMSQGSTGIMSTMLDQNNFRTADGIYYMKGELILPLSQLGGTDHAIAIDDAELINQNKNNGDILTQQSGATNQTIQGFDLNITYTLKTVQREDLSSHTVGTATYNTVTKADIIISAKVTTSIDVLGNPVAITLLDTQDIYTITNYYADAIGLIDSDAVFTYQLEDFSAFPQVTIPIPDTATVNTSQEITAYTVN